MKLPKRDIIRTGARLTKRKGLTCEQRDEILMLAQAGNGISDIADKFGVRYDLVAGIVRQNGIEFARPVLGVRY